MLRVSAVVPQATVDAPPYPCGARLCLFVPEMPQVSSPLEECLWQQIVATELPWPQREFRFCKRRWRWDFAFEHLLLAVEVQGGRWTKSTHNGGARQTKSFEKLAEAAVLGWKVIPVNAEMIENGTALALIQRAIHGDGE